MKNLGIMESIRQFLNSPFCGILKRWLYYLVFISICFFLIHHMYKNNRVYTISGLTRIMFLFLVYIIYSMCMETLYPLKERSTDLMYIILFLTFLAYGIQYIVIYYFPFNRYDEMYIKCFISAAGTAILFFIGWILLYSVLEVGDKTKASDAYSNFFDAWTNHSSFIYTYVIFLYAFYYAFQYTRFKVKAIDLTVANVMSGIILVMSYVFIIYLLRKLKVIKRTQVLSSILVLISITVIFIYLYGFFLMDSLTNICKAQVKETESQKKDIVSMLLFVSIIILLLLQDTENWRQLGYFIFILISVFILLCIVYFNTKYPSIGMLCFWGMIEWILVLMYKKDASFNSLHFMLMKS